MRKILIAPDSFKGTMTSIEVSKIMEVSVRKVYPEIETIRIPIADGGEGTVDAYLNAIGGKKHYVKVKDPLLRDIEAHYGILPDGDTAIIEMAQASGLPLLGEERDPMKATSYGTGELIKSALNKGCKRIILGIGGSATNDGGVGAFSALGVKYLDENNEFISANGEGLKRLFRIDTENMDKRLMETEILIACDVDNPLCGQNGASYMYGPQKGATSDQVRQLDKNLAHYAALLKKQHGGIDYTSFPGTGAAGGIGISFLYFTNAMLKSGIDIILDIVRFNKLVIGADFVLTGEGRIDGQSLRGKVPIGISKRSKEFGVPVFAIVGSIGENIEEVYKAGVDAVFSTTKDAVPFEIARKTSREDLAFLVESLMRFRKSTD